MKEADACQCASCNPPTTLKGNPVIAEPTLYKRDSSGKIRVWWIEQDGERYRYCAGIKDGKIVRSEWTVALPKNIGRSNSTDAIEQATAEVAAEYRKALELDYFENVADIDTPRFFAPMLAHKYEGWQGPCYVQPKLDGIRCIATRYGLFSRKGKPITAVPHIADALEPIFKITPAAVFDGELYNHELKEDFNTITSIVRKVKPSLDELAKSRDLIEYHIYDFPAALSDSFSNRFDALTTYVEAAYLPLGLGPLRVVPTVHVGRLELLDHLYGEWLEQGYEGQIIRLNKPYEQKRSKSLLKRKEFQDAEYPIVAIEEGIGNWSGFAKRVVLRLPDGRTFSAGIKGDQMAARRLLFNAAIYTQATVRFFNLTPDGVPRFPVVYTFHEGDRL